MKLKTFKDLERLDNKIARVKERIAFMKKHKKQYYVGAFRLGRGKFNAKKYREKVFRELNGLDQGITC